LISNPFRSASDMCGIECVDVISPLPCEVSMWG
jgi:hypothetical protein